MKESSQVIARVTGELAALAQKAVAVGSTTDAAVLHEAATDRPVYSSAPIAEAIQRRTRSCYGPWWSAKEASSARTQAGNAAEIERASSPMTIGAVNPTALRRATQGSTTV